MIVEDPYFDVCPVYNEKATLSIGFSKKKASPKDVGFTYDYIGCNCGIIRSGKYYPHVECPIIDKRGLRRSIRE